MSKKPEVVYAGRAELAEGPTWHDGALWWVDIVAGTLNRLDPQTGINTARGTGSFLGAATPTTDGRWLLARQNDCALLDWSTGQITSFTKLDERHGLTHRHRFNDGKCDARGRFWVGTMHLDRRDDLSAFYIIEPMGSVRKVLERVSLSNGLAWSPRGEWLYHIDTPTRQVSRFAYDGESGKLSERKTLITFAESDGFPDGMTIDSAGCLWIALWSGHAVVRVDGESGQIIERILVPAPQVSSCAFGGPGLRTLYITTAWEGLSFADREAHPLAGCIFSLETDTAGLPVMPFRIQ